MAVSGCAGETAPVLTNEASAPANVMSTEHEEGAGPAVSNLGEAADDANPATASYRVLVTGFNDWKELGDPPNIWLCKVNPSCRLLLGDALAEEPVAVEGGELVSRLRQMRRTPSGREIEWSFATMPVTWQIAESVPLADHDLVIHLGLGVYDRFDQLKLERGAYNERRGKDAAGNARQEPIQSDAPTTKSAPSASKTDAILDGLDGLELGDYSVAVAAARPENSYLCNETHYRALLELDAAREAGARLQRVHFLHIPYAENDDYARLADGVAALIERLVAGDAKPVRG